MGTAHWFSRKPNCRKRGVRSVVRAPFLGPWGSIAHRGTSVHLCTCNRGAQGWPPDLRRGGGTRDFREQERCSWASRRIFLVGRAAAPFIRSDVKLWQTTSSDRLNELRRCTRPGGEALYPPRRSASIISTSIPCPVLPSSWTREHERTPLFGYFESVDKISKELAQERDSNWKFSTNVVDMDCCSRNEISYVPLKNVFFYIIMRKNIFQLSIHCKIVEKG